jgi:hypothetical protein
LVQMGKCRKNKWPLPIHLHHCPFSTSLSFVAAAHLYFCEHCHLTTPRLLFHHTHLLCFVVLSGQSHIMYGNIRDQHFFLE